MEIKERKTETVCKCDKLSVKSCAQGYSAFTNYGLANRPGCQTGQIMCNYKGKL